MDNHAVNGIIQPWREGFERELLPFFPQRILSILSKINLSGLESLEEIRLRAGKPMILQNYKDEWFVETDGSLRSRPFTPFLVEQPELRKLLEMMSEHSIYAFQEEICSGYLTLKGGHRIGLTGRVVLEDQQIRNIKDISSVNIRLSGEIRGCCGKLVRYLFSKNGSLCNTLIVSPPQCGKTTVLRDIARVLSNGPEEIGIKGIKVGIVDERSEIASCYKGIPQKDVGLRTDVLDGCPKTIGMDMLVRSMSPKVIITDEIGNEGDREAVQRVLNAGVKIITSAHGYNISELKSRREVLGLLEEKVFDRMIVLSNSRGPGTLAEVVDGATMKPIEI